MGKSLFYVVDTRNVFFKVNLTIKSGESIHTSPLNNNEKGWPFAWIYLVFAKSRRICQNKGACPKML